MESTAKINKLKVHNIAEAFIISHCTKQGRIKKLKTKIKTQKSDMMVRVQD